MYIFDASIFGIQIAPTWYGLMYALGFIICYQYVKKSGFIKSGDMDSLLLYIFLGVIIGGRLGYVFLYDPKYFLDHLIAIPMTWKGGMSFHGGAIGVIIAMFLFAKKYGYSIFHVSDQIVTILPIALGLGRLGNYINGELPGFTPYDGPLAINKLGVNYFPSPLLEAFLEGFLLLGIMLLCKKVLGKRKISGISSGIFLFFYGIFRVIAEFFRLPDPHIGYIFGSEWITLGMIYTLPMILVGISMIVIQSKKLHTI